MEEKIIKAAVALWEMEDGGVRVASRGGAAGSSRLVLIDTKTGEEYDNDCALEEAGKAGYHV